eukprot:jgi/Mesvir1/233/Mv13576-RA.1
MFRKGGGTSSRSSSVTEGDRKEKGGRRRRDDRDSDRDARSTPRGGTYSPRGFGVDSELDYIFEAPDFDAKSYSRQQLYARDEEGLKELSVELRDLMAASTEDMRRSVFANYERFIQTSKEISELEAEALSLRSLLGTASAIISGMAASMATSSQEHEFQAALRRSQSSESLTGGSHLGNGLEDGGGATAEEDERWFLLRGTAWGVAGSSLDLSHGGVGGGMDSELSDAQLSRLLAFPGEVDALLAEHQLDGALEALEAAGALLREEVAKGTDKGRSNILSQVELLLRASRGRLADVLVAAAEDPMSSGDDIRFWVRALTRLGLPTGAQELLLTCHSQRLQQALRQVRSSGVLDAVSFTLKVSQRVVSQIAAALEDMEVLFPAEPGRLSTFSVWACAQMIHLASILRHQVLAYASVSGGLRASAESVRTAMRFCDLLADQGLVLAPSLLKELLPGLHSALRAQLHTIVSSATERGEDWTQRVVDSGDSRRHNDDGSAGSGADGAGRGTFTGSDPGMGGAGGGGGGGPTSARSVRDTGGNAAHKSAALAHASQLRLSRSGQLKAETLQVIVESVLPVADLIHVSFSRQLLELFAAMATSVFCVALAGVTGAAAGGGGSVATSAAARWKRSVKVLSSVAPANSLRQQLAVLAEAMVFGENFILPSIARITDVAAEISAGHHAAASSKGHPHGGGEADPGARREGTSAAAGGGAAAGGAAASGAGSLNPDGGGPSQGGKGDIGKAGGGDGKAVGDGPEKGVDGSNGAAPSSAPHSARQGIPKKEKEAPLVTKGKDAGAGVSSRDGPSGRAGTEQNAAAVAAMEHARTEVQRVIATVREAFCGRRAAEIIGLHPCPLKLLPGEYLVTARGGDGGMAHRGGGGAVVDEDVDLDAMEPSLSVKAFKAVMDQLSDEALVVMPGGGRGTVTTQARLCETLLGIVTHDRDFWRAVDPPQARADAAAVKGAGGSSRTVMSARTAGSSVADSHVPIRVAYYGLVQAALDMQFVLVMATAGGYSSRLLKKEATDFVQHIYDVYEVPLAARGAKPRELPREADLADIAKDALGRMQRSR